MAATLITDRTQADVDALKALLKKDIQSMTLAELAVFTAPHKGAYSYADYNRVGEAVEDLAEILELNGIGVSVTAKTDWTPTDNITQSDRATYLADLNALKDAFYGTTELPTAWENITFEDANNAEKLLLEIAQNVYCMQASFTYSGEVYSGEV